jgi:hypothetical protein
MAMFVHLAPESLVARIRRSGIARVRKAGGEFPGGVFAVPVTRNFFISHQWMRELKRRGLGPIAAFYFRIDDQQRVWVGHYGRAHQWMTAAQAVAAFMSDDAREGWEVVIPRRIAPGEVHRVRRLRQIFGWRYYPGAHGRAPCSCGFCTRGEYGAASLRRRGRVVR